MAGFGLRKNMVFDWKGATFRIERLQPNGEVLLEATNGGALSLVTRQQLLDDFAQGLVCALEPAVSVGNDVPSYARPLDQLSDEAQKQVKRRRRYLEAISADGKAVFTPEYLLPIIQMVADEIGKRLIEVMDLHPLKSCAFVDGDSEVMPVYDGDWLELAATENAGRAIFIDKFCSEQAVQSRELRRAAEKNNINDAIDALERELSEASMVSTPPPNFWT